MTGPTPPQKPNFFFYLIKAFRGGEEDYTSGSIRLAVFLLAIPMIAEMLGESLFAVVDIFFVGKLGNGAVETVAFTESVLSLVYSIAMGLGMAATAVVARRVGEKNLLGASEAGMQSILVAIGLSAVIAVVGVTSAQSILRLMGAGNDVVQQYYRYTQIMFGSNIVIMLLFLINGIFRGAGDASIAMRSLWIGNICNIILCPLLIYGWGPIPGFGLKGAAMATVFGRGTGVLYQLYRLFIHKGLLSFYLRQLKPRVDLLWQIVNIGGTATLQFLVGSASWLFLTRIMASFNIDGAVAGYQVAIRLLLFFILPAWGLSNAAATLTGQNLGAGKPERAEQSIKITTVYTVIFMLCVSIFFFLFGKLIVNFMVTNAHARYYSLQALQIISLGYVFFGVEMVMLNAFNGAGDTRTPTYVNLFAFWLFQIPLAWILTHHYIKEPKGIFITILISQFVAALVSYILFRRGSWKKVRL